MLKLVLRAPFAAAVVLALATVPAGAQVTPDFVAMFAEAETLEIDGQVAGTYPTKNELLVKIRNNYRSRYRWWPGPI